MNQINTLRLEFLNDTVNYYSVNPPKRRNEVNGSCKYYPVKPTSEGCAIGRKIKNKARCVEWDDMDTNPSVSAGYVFRELPEELRLLGVDFLRKVQDLHDNSIYWDDHGISEKGQRHVDKIKELLQEDTFDGIYPE